VRSELTAEQLRGGDSYNEQLTILTFAFLVHDNN